MSGRLPSPITVTDELLAAVVDRLDSLTRLINDRLPANSGGRPVPAGSEDTLRLDLTEPAQPGMATTAEASTPDGNGMPLTEPKPRKITARKTARRPAAKE
jgi:hypothetical protein